MSDTRGIRIVTILATPEYHGSFSSMLQPRIENLGLPSAKAGKSVIFSRSCIRSDRCDRVSLHRSQR